MTVLSVPLPESLETFVSEQVACEGHPSASEYLLSLLRQAQQGRIRAELECKLLAGIQSLDRGEGREMTSADWERLRDRVRQQTGSQEGA